MSEIDCRGTDEIVCPYCGHEQRDSWESSGENDDEECSECGKHYTYDSEVSRTFSSWQVACLNGDAHKWREWEDYGPFLSRQCNECGKRDRKKKEEQK